VNLEHNELTQAGYEQTSHPNLYQRGDKRVWVDDKYTFQMFIRSVWRTIYRTDKLDRALTYFDWNFK
jgi:hypothetical protein